MTPARTRIDGALLVPMDGPPGAPLGAVRVGSLRFDGPRISALGALAPEPGETVIDARGLTALPGFVQGHLHLCQTLLRGLADDLPLLRWLHERIWPLEAAHDAASIRASARLAVAELLASGTTTIQAIETVHETEVAAETLLGSPLTAIFGNCLMDRRDGGVPARLATGARDALRISAELRRAYDGRDGRLFYAVSPRFVLSCSPELLDRAGGFAAEHGLRVHTHAGEHPDECAEVLRQLGAGAVERLDRHRLLGARAGLAHCVHLAAREVDLLTERDVAVLHCPSANQKLGSGVAPIADYAARGIRIALGADGAPCNNRLSALTELRGAALLQSLHAGPGAWPATAALRAATLGGAEALGLADRVGSLTPGKRADVLLFDLGDVATAEAVASALVYAADERNLRRVFAGGAEPQIDLAAVRAEAAVQRLRLLGRAGM